MKIEPTTKTFLYEEVFKNNENNFVRTLSEREKELYYKYPKQFNYKNLDRKIGNTLKGLWLCISNDTDLENNIKISPNVLLNCILFPLMTMPSKKETFISKLNNNHPESITATEKVEYIEQIRVRLSTFAADASIETLKEYYADKSISLEDEEKLLQMYNDEWHETIDEWLENIIEKIEDEEKEKQIIETIANKTKDATRKYFEHAAAAYIPYPATIGGSSNSETLFDEINYLKSSPLLSDFDQSEKFHILKILEMKIDDAIQDWYDMIDTAIDRKTIESDYYIDEI